MIENMKVGHEGRLVERLRQGCWGGLGRVGTSPGQVGAEGLVSQGCSAQLCKHPRLSVREILAEVAQLPGQLVHHLLEDHWVNILAQHVEKEPVPDVGLLDNGVDDLTTDEPEADVEEVGAHLRAQHNDESVQDHQHAQDGQQNKPGIGVDFDCVFICS